MKKILTCVLVALGVTCACGQSNNEKKDVATSDVTRQIAERAAPKAKTSAAGSYETDAFKTKSGKTITFHALMHASIRMEYDGKEIAIDPVQKLRDRTVDYSKMPKADYVFVTHEHMDHFDKKAIKQLTKDGTQ